MAFGLRCWSLLLGYVWSLSKEKNAVKEFCEFLLNFVDPYRLHSLRNSQRYLLLNP
jgi:hypothetical protein